MIGEIGYINPHLTQKGSEKMVEKPILFSTEMVRAILEGRKMQTRRIVKPQPAGKFLGPEWYKPVVINKDGEEEPGEPVYGIYSEDGEWGIKAHYCPGDILWVQETWFRNDECLLYKASKYENTTAYHGRNGWVQIKWKPSIHMPREAARLFLKVTDVRVERLQEITALGISKEGITMPSFYGNDISPESYLIVKFQDTWQSLYAKRGYPWESNPYVWVIEFEKH